MAVLPIIHYPDPVLLTVGKPVGDDEFNSDLESLVRDMFETMEKAGGVGIAAPQVGVSKRIFVMDVPAKEDGRERHVVINPEIVHVEGEQVGDEGCLSFPGLFQVVKRQVRTVVRARDVNGDEIELDVAGLAARCVLHETDHCDGIVFLSRMSALKRELAKQKIKRLQKEGKWN